MAQLGYHSYIVQGGDHGVVLAPHLGRVDAQHVRGIHVNAATLGISHRGRRTGEHLNAPPAPPPGT